MFTAWQRGRWKVALAAVVFVSASVLAGCAAKRVVLAPAPTATIASGAEFQGAEAQADGVLIIAAANEWNDTPRNLSEHVVPLRVRIENHSSYPLRISYEDFNLEAGDGRAFAALPPAAIEGTAYVGQNLEPKLHAPMLINAAFDPQNPQKKTGEKVHVETNAKPPGKRHRQVVIVPGFFYKGFYPAPYWSYWYDGLTPWPYAWAPDVGYYNRYYPEMYRIKLPTQSMLRKAIPEGVVQPGGYISGFLYFSKLSDDINRVDLNAKLVDARTGQQFGSLQVPFVVVKPGEKSRNE